MAFDLSVNRWKVEYREFDGAKIEPNANIDIYQTQMAVYISKKLFVFEPYIGGKYTYSFAKWNGGSLENGTYIGNTVNGYSNGTSWLMGLQISLLSANFKLNFENSRGNESFVSLGISLSE